MEYENLINIEAKEQWADEENDSHFFRRARYDNISEKSSYEYGRAMKEVRQCIRLKQIILK